MFSLRTTASYLAALAGTVMCTQEVVGDYVIADLGAPVGYVGTFANGINASGVALSAVTLAVMTPPMATQVPYGGTSGLPTWAKATRLR